MRQRKIVQIAVSASDGIERVYALDADHVVWRWGADEDDEDKWEALPPLPAEKISHKCKAINRNPIFDPQPGDARSCQCELYEGHPLPHFAMGIGEWT